MNIIFRNDTVIFMEHVVSMRFDQDRIIFNFTNGKEGIIKFDTPDEAKQKFNEIAGRAAQ